MKVFYSGRTWLYFVLMVQAHLWGAVPERRPSPLKAEGAAQTAGESLAATIDYYLRTRLPLNGRDLYLLDVQTRQMGQGIAPRTVDLLGDRTGTNVIQHRNYVAVAAILGWDCTGAFTNRIILGPELLRCYAQEYLSLPPTTNSLKLYQCFVEHWLSGWKASPVEDSLLRTLSLIQPDLADVLFQKISQNPENQMERNTNVVWYTWRQYKQERQKAKAAVLEKKYPLNPRITGTSRYKSAPVDICVLWPRAARCDLYMFSATQKKWFDTLIPEPASLFVMGKDWSPPHDRTYRRSWQQGPSWQVRYQQENGELVRICTYEETDSYIQGSVLPKGFQETILTPTHSPKQILKVGAHLLQVEESSQ